LKSFNPIFQILETTGGVFRGGTEVERGAQDTADGSRRSIALTTREEGMLFIY
jgi:hypothetical protein